jgi:hypothetical protein
MQSRLNELICDMTFLRPPRWSQVGSLRIADEIQMIGPKEHGIWQPEGIWPITDLID